MECQKGVRSELTGSSGRVEFERLPRGRLHVQAFHPFYAPLSNGDGARALEVDGACSTTVVMQDMYGVVFSCPSRSAPESASWKWRLTDFDQSYGVISRLSFCRSELEQRFPDAQVFLHRPRPSNEGALIGCDVVLADATFWRGRSPLFPLRTIREPVVLEQEIGARFRKLRIIVRSTSGREVDLHLKLASADPSQWTMAGAERSVEAGRDVLLRYGGYLVQAVNHASWLAKACEGWSFTVSDTEPAGDAVELPLRGAFVPIRIVPVVPGESLLSPVFLIADDEHKNGIAIASWRPDQGPIRMLAPVGKLLIKFQSKGYEGGDLQFDIGADEWDREIRLPLVERK